MKKTPTAPLTHGVAKVPVVIQLEALECGAASLTMVLAYYGKWLPLEQVRLDCGVSRDGSNLKNVIAAARSYGLTPSAFRMEPEALREQGEFPCIIHWNFNHFVVLNGFKGDKAVLNDPARGTYSVSMEEFDSAFTGICVFFRPGEDFVPDGKQKSVLPFAAKKLSGTGAAFALVVLSTVIASLLGIILPGFARVFTDRLLTRQNAEWFVPFILLFGGIILIEIVVSWIQSVYSFKANGKIAIVSNAEYMWHVLRLPVEFFTQRLVGDVTMRKEQSASIANTLISTLAPLFIQGIMMIFYLLVLLRYSWKLTAVGVLSVGINLLLSRMIGKKQNDLSMVMSRDAGKLYSSTVAAVEMIDSIKAAGAEDGYFERWSGFQAASNASQIQLNEMLVIWAIIPSFVSVLTNTIVLMGSVALCMRGNWTVGMIAAFSGYLQAFLSPADAFLDATQTIQTLRTDMERIEDVMEYPTDVPESVELDEEHEFSKLSGKIELRHVTFGYSRLAPPLIEDFSMTVEPGQRVAFVGSSGCGKSTLSKLISGLYKPWSGEILFDGVPIDQIDRTVFTSSLSVVDQDITLFSDSISDNIRMWDRSIEDFEVILAARDAQIHTDIMQREGGYNRILAEGGKDLSGGQRQRLEIARVLAEDPTIVILDEATSALDAKTEFNVVRSIQLRGITSVVVAHRLSTIRDCDEIIVLDHGKVVERGTHAELYAANGAYASLVDSD